MRYPPREGVPELKLFARYLKNDRSIVESLQKELEIDVPFEIQVDTRDVLPSVTPGYLSDLLPNEMPEKSEDWKTILEDIKRVIVPGVTHWQSPNFHAYYPTATSYPSIVGEMISAGFAVIGFSWISSPACTELEVIVMDWLAKFLNLPSQFLNSAEGPGGGTIQGSASEAILVAVLSAREQTVRKHMNVHPEWSEADIRGRLVAYSSDQSNSCVEKAGLLAAVPIRLISTGDDFTLNGEKLQKTIEEDLTAGKIPIICVATSGSTGTCAYDDLTSLGDICQQYGIWLHVDAAYAGIAYCLPECKDLLRGMECADSLNFNLHKAMKVNFDCTAMWFKNSERVVDSFMVDRIYLKHQYQGQNPKAPDYRHWQIPLGRRFRALKVWIVMRTYGADLLRDHIRHYFVLSEQFEKCILDDNRFELACQRSVGLVCFRFKDDHNNQLTKDLLDRITDRKKIYLIQATHNGKHFLRFVVAGMDPKASDIEFAWEEISLQADKVLREQAKVANELFSDAKISISAMAEQLNVVLAIDADDKEKTK